MDRRSLIAGVLASAITPLVVAAGSTDESKRVGILHIGQGPGPEELARLNDRSFFLATLGTLGWVRGKNLVIERRWGESADKLPEVAAELIRLKVDLIVATNAVTAAAAKRATSTIPIVFATLSDPVAQGLVTSLARPGGNLTGVAAEPTAGKRLELLRDLVPGITRVAVLVNPTNPATSIGLRQVDQVARALKLSVQRFLVAGASDLDRAWSAMEGWGPGGLLVADDPVLKELGPCIRELAGRMRLPVVYGHREDALAGGLAAFSAILDEQFARVADLVDRILRGADPGRLPVHPADRFEIVINMKAAKALGLSISPSVLARADRVIE